MSGFINGDSRSQSTLFPEALDDYITTENPVRVIDVFVDSLDLSSLGFKTDPANTGRPGYHPATLLKLYIYGYLDFLIFWGQIYFSVLSLYDFLGTDLFFRIISV